MTLKSLTKLHNCCQDNDQEVDTKTSLNQASIPGNGNEVTGGVTGATIPGNLILEAGAGSRSPAPTPTLFDQKIPESLYLDVGDNVHANVCTWLDSNCGANDGQWFIPGVCENGHRIAKIIACGKEWCPVCSKVGSIAHNRRYVRWLPKIMQFKRMRYFVFTIPEDIRDNYRTKKALTKLGRQVQELLKKHDYERGLRRWHFFGDNSHKFHPHLNVLVEGGYLNKATLQSIKDDYADILGVEVADVHATYKRKPGDMAGCLHYMTRATFLDYNWDIEFAMEIRNFRNMVVWGRNWNNAPAWEVDKLDRKDAETGEVIDVQAIEKVVNGTCHVCGSHITWETALPAQILTMLDKESLGAGYYRIIDRSPPRQTPESLVLTVRRRCADLEKGRYNHTFDSYHEKHRKHADLRKRKLAERQEIEAIWADILKKGAENV